MAEHKGPAGLVWHPGLARTWGDGGNDQRPHVIEDIDLSSPTASQFIHCGPCDSDVIVGEHPSLDKAWAAHRGLEYRVPHYGEQADDSEVAEFLSRVEDPQYQAHMAGSFSVTRPGDDLEDAFALLDRLL